MNQTLQGTVDVRSCASPVIQALSEKYGETVHLAVMERHRSCRHTPLEMRRSVRQTGPAAAVSDTEPIPGPGAKPAA